MNIDYSSLVFSGRGVTALWAILRSLNCQGRRILLPVNICEIVYPIITNAEMIPIFYDVDGSCGNATLKNIEQASGGSEAVLLAVHNFGAPLEIDHISSWAKRKNIFLIEDVCNSLGATYKGISLGSWGDAAIFSFGYAKIVEYGLGGAALIKDIVLREKVAATLQSLAPYSDHHESKNIDFQKELRRLRNDAISLTPSFYTAFYDEYSKYLLYKLSSDHEKQIHQMLTGLSSNLASRAEKALRYRNEIISVKITPVAQIDGQIYWRYNFLIEAELRHDLIERIRANNLLVSTWYPPIAELFLDKSSPDRYPGSISFGSRVVNLFVDDRVSQADITRTIEIINSV